MEIKLLDCIDIVGESCKNFDGEKNYISTGAVGIDEIDKNKVEIVTFKNKPSRANVIVKNGDILFAKMQATNKVLKINKELANNIYSTGFYAVRAKEDMITNKCLFHLLQSEIFNNKKDKECHGATQKALNNDGIAKIIINLPDINKQGKIGDELDKINNLISNQKHELELLDELVKARFVEMFGDVLTNTKNFDTCLFGDYVNQMNIGPFGSDLKNDCFVPKEEGYCMVYEQKHAIDKDMSIEARYVNETKYNQMKRFDIGPGDIIVSCRGTIGKCFILPEDAPHGIIHPSLMMIKPKDNVNNRFLVFLLENILKEQQEQGSGVKMAIKATELSKIKCIKPSRELQDDFIEFIKKLDKSKLLIQQSIDKTQELFDSLMQEYFG